MVGSDAEAEGKSAHWPQCFLFERGVGGWSLSKKSEDEMVR